MQLLLRYSESETTREYWKNILRLGLLSGIGKMYLHILMLLNIAWNTIALIIFLIRFLRLVSEGDRLSNKYIWRW
jgi:hypothetical protein